MSLCLWVAGCAGEPVGHRWGIDGVVPVCANHHGGYTTPPRWTEDAYLLGIAQAVAQRGTCGRLRVGAVLAREGRILSTGYNGAPAGEAHCQHDDDLPCQVSVHAEVNALIFAARHGVASEGATLYLTHSPCFGCAGLVINAGVKSVRYARDFRLPDGVERLKAAGVPCSGGD